MARTSLQRRLFVGAAIWIVLALVTTALVLSVLFRNHLENDLARRLDADFLQLVSQFDVDAQGRLLHSVAMSDPLYQRVLSGRYWQIERGGQVSLHSRSLWDATIAIGPQVSGERVRLTGPRGVPRTDNPRGGVPAARLTKAVVLARTSPVNHPFATGFAERSASAMPAPEARVASRRAAACAAAGRV